jgi:hypothetical protein
MIRHLVLASALGLALVPEARAQKRKPQVAGIAPAPAAQPERDAERHHRSPGNYGRVPAFVAQDGRVYANFGYGYEQVLRSCSVQHSPGYAQPTYNPPAYQAPTYTPPTYSASTFGPSNTQPAPAQPTGSERALPSNQGTTVAPTTAGIARAPATASTGGAACWTQDAEGRVVVVRP